MKQIISFLAFIVLFAINVKCQIVAFDIPSGKQEYTTYSPPNFVGYKEHRRKMCTTAKVGLISMGGGLVLAAYGIGVAFGGDPNNSSTGILIGSAVIFVAGVGLAIGGGIHDFVNRKHRFSIIALKRNQLGLAYSF